jgi:outer membrane receptor protein involved in Fe transport
VLAALVAPPLFAQNPSGTLTGRVEDSSGAPLPGVTVVATSDSLQGDRVAVTNENGTYKLAFLPPGTYRVTYELEGFKTSSREIKLSAAQTTISDISMELGEVSEEIVVSGNLSTISETNTGAATYTKDEIESLPIARDLTQTTLLAPGVSDTGPGGRTSTNDRAGNVRISGAMSFENLWLVNGVVVNENVRGQSLPLFIEDAIQETTTSTSGVSAEYGRFTGGVINAITKSGGNNFSGSLRTNLVNDDWAAKTPLSGDRLDDIGQIYEGTLGGFLWRDHLWFFAAGRDFETNGTDQTVQPTLITYPTGDAETRLEGKLTVTPHPSHTVVGSYTKIDSTSKGSSFGSILDLDSVNVQREDPQEIKSINYTGILTQNMFVEGQYSERDYTIGIGSGGVPDLIEGTLIRSRRSGVRFHAPTFCGSCEDEIRNNKNLVLKGSYFLNTSNVGTHDLIFGYDTFDDIRFSINHQTGSDFTTYASDVLIGGDNTVYPIFGNSSTPQYSTPWIRFFDVFNEDLAEPTGFTTNSFYVNDSWNLNDRWSFNVGLRYDENDGTNSAGALVTNDNKISPRLGVSYDLSGDGDLVLNASYGTYVAAIANSRADSTSNGGAIGSYIWNYDGPAINTDPNCVNTNTCVSSSDALRTVFDWYTSLGGNTESTQLVNPNAPINVYNIQASIPGATSVIRGSIKSPSAEEFTVGINKQLGSRGSVRADVVYRTWSDFYSDNTTVANGTVDTTAGPQDLTVVGNFGDSVLEREYLGLHTQARYRVTDKLRLAGSYTLSQLKGNVNGETAASGPVPASPFSYPEYSENSWAYPVGDLNGDQRNRLKAWAIYDIFNTQRHSLSVSLLESFSSGAPYGAVGSVDVSNFVTNPGYADPPDESTYFYTARDAFHTDTITRTDLSFNYAFTWNAFGESFEIFIQPEILNLFDEKGVINVNTDIVDSTNTNALAPFNPFNSVPVEGVNWRRGDTFGQPESEFDYQTPRTYRVSLGFRF